MKSGLPRTPPEIAQKLNVSEFFLSFENFMANFIALFAFSGVASSCTLRISN